MLRDENFRQINSHHAKLLQVLRSQLVTSLGPLKIRVPNCLRLPEAFGVLTSAYLVQPPHSAMPYRSSFSDN